MEAILLINNETLVCLFSGKIEELHSRVDGDVSDQAAKLPKVSLPWWYPTVKISAS